MKRILLIGCAGTGKSTIAPILAKRFKLPCIHLDQVFWKPGWVEPQPAEFDRKLLKILKTRKWVMDGQYGRTQDLRMKYADTVIVLDLSRWICLWRVLGRILKTYGRTRPDMAPGCNEQFDWPFLLWIWNFKTRGRIAMFERLRNLKKNQRVVILKTPGEVQRFMDNL